MDLNTIRSSPILTDSVSVNKPRLGLSSNLLQYSQPAPAYSASLYRTISRKKISAGSADEVHSSLWSDPPTNPASLPQRKLIWDFCLEQASQTSQESDSPAYKIWLMRYPSALTSFYQIARQARGKRIVLFLDYDGTLSPIVSEPDLAFMSTEMRIAVKNVAKYFPTAIISGRSRDKVREFVQLSELYYAGSHGMDIMGPVRKVGAARDHPKCIRTTKSQGKELNLLQPAYEFLPIIDEVFRSLIEIAKEFKGSKIESNKFCLSVHYRLVDPKFWNALEEQVKDALRGYPRMRLTYGRKVLEIRPDIDWDKGRAVEFLLESLGLDDSDDVFPIYLGDDRTDEDAFKVLREGNRGFGIVVTSKPKASQAFYSLKDTNEVMFFLRTLFKWRSCFDNTLDE